MRLFRTRIGVERRRVWFVSQMPIARRGPLVWIRDIGKWYVAFTCRRAERIAVDVAVSPTRVGS